MVFMTGISTYSPQQHSDFSYGFLPCGKPIEVDLKASLREKLNCLPGNHKIEKAVALNALKSIARVSAFKSFITKPVVVILTGLLIVALGTFAAVAGGLLAASLGSIALMIAVRVVAFVFGLVGGGLIGWGFFQGLYTSNLKNLSNEYAEQAKDARRMIAEIEPDTNLVVELALEK
jgi:hypothetical protein